MPVSKIGVVGVGSSIVIPGESVDLPVDRNMEKVNNWVEQGIVSCKGGGVIVKIVE